MKLLLVLTLAIVTYSFPAHAGQKVQFDAEVILHDSEADRLFMHKQTYQAEFQPAPEGVRDAFSEMLSFRAEVPIKRPSNGELLPRNFGLVIYRYVDSARKGKAFTLSADIGPGQPLNEHTRWVDIGLNDLNSFTGLTLHGETVDYPEVNGRRPFVMPTLEISNFKVLD